MEKPFRKIVQDLQWLNFWIRHCCDQAEAKVRDVNQLVRELGANGLVNETVLLGPVIHHRYYPPQSGGSDSGQLVQAALHVPRGYGVALWDTEDYASLKEVSQGLEAEVWQAFVPFDQCEQALKALMLPHIKPLLEQLQQRLS